MICMDELLVMKEAYEKLYIIENQLRKYIKQEMEKTYGIHWFYVAPQKVLKRMPNREFNSLHFYEIESYLRIYKQAFPNISPKIFRHLQRLYPIRNKIAHNHLLTEEEIDQLTNSYNYIIGFTLKVISFS